MDYKHLVLISMLLPAIIFASDSQLVDEDEIEKWGYITSGADNKSGSEVILKIQHIKSKNQVKGKKYHYYYYTLSEECFDNRMDAIKRKSSLLFLDEKDYRLSELSGKCVRIIDTSAKFGTFKEQPRIFSLFNKYLAN